MLPFLLLALLPELKWSRTADVPGAGQAVAAVEKGGFVFLL